MPVWHWISVVVEGNDVGTLHANWFGMHFNMANTFSQTHKGRWSGLNEGAGTGLTQTRVGREKRSEEALGCI